jgi:YNFM family putative membrane transporter
MTLSTFSEGLVQSGSDAYRRINLALFCAGFVTFITLYDVQPLLPLFAREYAVTPATASLPLSCCTVSLALGMLVAGTLSESLGRRRIMAGALFLTSLLSLSTLLSHSFTSLLLLRLLQGIALSGVPSVAMAYIGEEMDAQSVGPAMGLYISGNALGGMSGRIGSALLADLLPWRGGILVVGLVCLVLTLVFLKSLPPSAHFRKRPFQVHSLAASLAGHLREPALCCLFALAFLAMGGFVALYNYLGFRLQAPPYAFSQSTASLIFLVYLLGSFSSSIAGRLLNRFGRSFMIRATLTAMAAGTLLTLAEPVWSIIAGVGLFTCGFFGLHATASSWVGRRARTAKAQATSLYLFCYYLGSSVSGTAGGVFWAAAGWPGVAAMIGLLILLAFLVAGLLLRLTAEEIGLSGPAHAP